MGSGGGGGVSGTSPARDNKSLHHGTSFSGHKSSYSAVNGRVSSEDLLEARHVHELLTKQTANALQMPYLILF